MFVKVDDSDDSSVMVMSGFLAATQSLYPQVVSQLETLLLENPGYKVVFAGKKTKSITIISSGATL